MLPNKRVRFRPILSARAPAIKGPRTAPNGSREPIKPASLSVIASFKGVKLGFCSFGITGEVHPNVIPHVNAAKFPTIKLSTRDNRFM